MRSELRELQQRLGLTVVYVTHDQAEAMSMADQVVLLHKGQVEQCAAPREMYARPASTFAARFIGTPAMNLVLLESGCIAGSRWRVGGDGAPCMGLRPEAIAVAHGGASLSGAREPGAIELPAQVVGQEYLGADLVLRCQVGSEVLTVRAPGPQQVAPGAPVLLRWSAQDTHFFDGNGQRVASAAVSPDVLVALRAAA